MKITNKQGLPEAFVQMAQSNYRPTPRRYSATALLKGVREVILERRHGDEIQEDVSDMIWMLFGTAVHSILERQKTGADQIKENYVVMPVGDYSVSGRFDLFDSTTKTVTDYKTCSVWKIIHGEFDDWKKQLLIYATIMRHVGYDVRHGQIVALMKDHSKSKAKFDPTYPQFPVKTIKYDFTDKDFQEIDAFIHDRISQLAKAEKLPDDKLPICTAEERLNAGDKFAVMRKGRKSALRVVSSRQEAEEYMQKHGGDYIQARPGVDKKCKDYCSTCQFCNYYREHIRGAKHEHLSENS
jgi:hypothetical protein